MRINKKRIKSDKNTDKRRKGHQQTQKSEQNRKKTGMILWKIIGFRGDSYTIHCEHERLLHQETLLRVCRAACVCVCACVYPECSRLEDSTTLSRCSAPQLRRNESFSFSLDSIVTCTHQHVSQEAPLHYPWASYIVIFTFFLTWWLVSMSSMRTPSLWWKLWWMGVCCVLWRKLSLHIAFCMFAS